MTARRTTDARPRAAPARPRARAAARPRAGRRWPRWPCRRARRSPPPRPPKPRPTAPRSAWSRRAAGSCHGAEEPEAGLDLSPATAGPRRAVNVPSRTQPGLLLVDPGRPERSALFLKTLPADRGALPAARGCRCTRRRSTRARRTVLRGWIGSFDPAVWGEPESARRRVARAGGRHAATPARQRPVPIFQDTRLINCCRRRRRSARTASRRASCTASRRRWRRPAGTAWAGSTAARGLSLGVRGRAGGARRPRAAAYEPPQGLGRVNGEGARWPQQRPGRGAAQSFSAVELGWEYLQERDRGEPEPGLARRCRSRGASASGSRCWRSRCSRLAHRPVRSRPTPTARSRSGLGGELWLNALPRADRRVDRAAGGRGLRRTSRGRSPSRSSPRATSSGWC